MSIEARNPACSSAAHNILLIAYLPESKNVRATQVRTSRAPDFDPLALIGDAARVYTEFVA